MSTSLLNRLEDAHRTLNELTGEISPECGCLGRSCPPGGVKDSRPEVERILDDIVAAADYIREKLT